MTRAVVYALSVESSAASAPDAIPRPILSRQLPRLAVHLLNGPGDRGLRFFPLIGREGAERRFFVVEEMLSVETLLSLHGQEPAPQFVVDGCIHGEGIRLRIHDGVGGQTRFDSVIPFDQRDPLAAVSRMMFELTGVLEWPGAPPQVPDLAGPGLNAYLIARDQLLGLEAELIEPADPQPLSTALDALLCAPHEPEVRQLAIEICARLARPQPAEVAEGLDRACTAVGEVGAQTGEFLTAVAAVLETCGAAKRALRRYEDATELDPARADAACRAATLHFDGGRPEMAHRILSGALQAGQRATTVLAQLAVLEQQLGNTEAHEGLIEELLLVRDLRPPVVRLAVTYLLDRDRAAEAIDLVEACLQEEPQEPGPWFDLGRALLSCRRYQDARSALRKCLELAPTNLLAREVERHLRFVEQPELIDAMRELDDALSNGEHRIALRRARKLVRRNPRVAEAWLFLGVIHQRMDRASRAERALSRALDLDPDLGEAHNRLGILLVGKGRFRDGYEHLQRAVELLPNEPSARIHLAQALRHLGQHEEAQRALVRARALGGSLEAVDAVRRTLRLRGAADGEQPGDPEQD